MPCGTPLVQNTSVIETNREQRTDVQKKNRATLPHTLSESNNVKLVKPADQAGVLLPGK
jgi:hypothetical protein